MCGAGEESGRCFVFLEEKDFLLNMDPEGSGRWELFFFFFLLSGGASVLHLISGTRTEVLGMSSVCPDPNFRQAAPPGMSWPWVEHQAWFSLQGWVGQAEGLSRRPHEP